MQMSKLDRPIMDRATPEMVQWVETVDRNAAPKARRVPEAALATARAAHEAVWQGPRTQRSPLFASVAGSGGARPEDFSFFFYSPPGNGAVAASDDETARRLRRLQMLKLMLQQATKESTGNG
jgi:hypothetical protein